MRTAGERIRQIRMNMGWTQERLAREAGLSKSFMSDLENNKTTVSGNNLLKIAQVLGASLDYLMKGDGGKPIEEPKTIEIPIELSRAAEECSILFSEVLILLDVQESIMARRNSKQNRTMKEEDWKQLFEKARSFME